MKFKFILLNLVICSIGARAQNMVSMSSIHPAADTAGIDKKELAIRYPSLRQFGISANNYGYSDLKVQLTVGILPRVRSGQNGSALSSIRQQFIGRTIHFLQRSIILIPTQNLKKLKVNQHLPR
ncbi:hypothetical protein CEY12_01360 [Chryseobacterium sp. T16E-39]|uniref:hypothetical protein n=1 Tax=Chryseobacterium sp. T16E-39 TaxID=2015076 RepID=UPI000B5B1270|nr:hypothetical protein [Chryseobacterium sp. T16E-39]ASK28836.1 hypothetical protein CEY12_01360 [Chryseobacterium sp. T16E-39]